MPQAEFMQFWRAITVIEAQETMRGFTVSQFPHLTKDSRKKVHREMHSMAFPSELKDEETSDKAVSTREYARIMGGLKLGR